MSGARLILVTLLLALLATGCGDDGYRVRVVVPGGAARTTRVDVYLLGSCGEIDAPGERPGAPIAAVDALSGDAPLGHVPPGAYGLYGRAWETGCHLFAAGCAPVTVRAGGDGTLTVTLTMLDPPRGCDAGEVCHDDTCAPGDGGVECVLDTDCDDEIACTRDVCPDDGTCLHAPDSTACGDDEICFAPVGCIPERPCRDASDCDDGNPCSGVEQCVEGTCRPGEPLVCDDGDFCNGPERCEPDANGCVSGDPPTCADGVDCTDDQCADGACVHRPEARRCDDGKFCNGTESCDVALGCQPGPAPCDDGRDCTADQCVELEALCLHHADHDRCGPAELCADVGDGFACQVVACAADGDCDDGNACNGAETCGPDSTCLATLFVPCDDGVFCNGAEYCEDGACQTQQPPGCSDGVNCTLDVCDPVLDGCAAIPADEQCDDGLICTLDRCGGLGCEALPLDCDDGSACTVDRCSEPAGGCTGSIVDRDGDARGDAACGGIDCDDSDPFRYPGAAEACNAADDDCDGQVDETFACAQGATSTCTTACGTTGTATCTEQCDGSGPCVPPPEDCNGVDDDCDGATDEGCGCVGSEQGACTTACGSQGTRTCVAGTWSPCAPPAEVCNDADDDCSGTADDTFACRRGTVSACTTGCGSAGSQTCDDQCAWGPCDPPPEVCNGADDDCDEVVDEDFSCVQGQSGQCTTGCGSIGTRSCGATCVWGECAPPAELCNGADDDCDGACDDGFACCAGGTAGGCVTRCNTWGSLDCGDNCSPAQTCTVPAEICNGRDDDCDGSCDEPAACCLGRRSVCPVAAGVQGHRLCKAGCMLGMCCADAEICGNLVDDDCDLQIDEAGCCSAITASPELCNARDDDCDGLCDDGFGCCRGTNEACTTTCNTTGIRTCDGACAWGACTPPTEVCGNHIDDDCDGEIDEGCPDL